MDGQKALSRCHKIQQGPLCRCRKCIPVGKNHQGIIFAQGLGIQVRQIIRVGDVDSLRTKCCHQLWNAFDGLVVSFVAKKKHFNAARLLGESS